MAEQLPKDQASLEELKRAIDAVDAAWKDDSVSDYVAAALRAEAWRTAFEWRDYFGGNVNRDCPCRSCREDCAEYDEGLRLIRESLK